MNLGTDLYEDLYEKVSDLGPRLRRSTHTICVLTDFGILNSIACRILNSDQFLNWILTENELDSRVHIYFTEKVICTVPIYSNMVNCARPVRGDSEK